MSSIPKTPKTPKIQRKLKFVFRDGSEKYLEIGRYTSIKAGVLNKVMLHIDKLDGDKMLLICNEDLVEDFSSVDRIEVVRINN